MNDESTPNDEPSRPKTPGIPNGDDHTFLHDTKQDMETDAKEANTLNTAGDSEVVPEEMLPMAKRRLALLLIASVVVAADFCVYRACGMTGPAVFLALASVTVCLGIPRRWLGVQTLFLWVLLAVAILRTIDNGNVLLMCCSVWLLIALSASFRQRIAYIPDTFVYASECIPGGYSFFSAVNQKMREQVLDPAGSRSHGRSIEIILPVISVVLFGSVFVMANPDMVSVVSISLGNISQFLRGYLQKFSLWEIAFWLYVAWMFGGLLRPLQKPPTNNLSTRDKEWGDEESSLYSAFRNTLLTLITLFLVYLGFESRAFVERKPPAGFTYSSYAHEGAAWLTVALGMATLTLSLIFRGRTLIDPRLPRLRQLALIWTVLNLALAVAVYNRMYIYVGFNGMTRMRVIGTLGITSVAAGFGLVVVKLYRRRSFGWLIQRQLWVVGFAVFLFAVMPIDRIIHHYNVRQILSGNEAAVVQITAHPVDDEALPTLLPLCDIENSLIARGIQGMLSVRTPKLQITQQRDAELGWTTWQRHVQLSVTRLQNSRQSWDVFPTKKAAAAAFEKLSETAYRRWW